MAFSVVCISRTSGALGDLVGMGVARELGYRYVDEAIVERAAEKAGVDLATMEEAEERKSFVRRLLDALPSPSALVDPFKAISGQPMGFEEVAVLGPRTVRRDPRDVIRSVIGEFARAGRVVIVAHAASMALSGKADVLRVLVTASATARAERISHDGRLLEPDDAVAAIEESDGARADYFRRFYDIDQELPTHYDVVVSTDVLAPQQAVEIVCAAARVAGA